VEEHVPQVVLVALDLRMPAGVATGEVLLRDDMGPPQRLEGAVQLAGGTSPNPACWVRRASIRYWAMARHCASDSVPPSLSSSFSSSTAQAIS